MSAKSKESAVELVDLQQYQEAKSERLPVLKTYKLYIGGKFPRTESGRSYQVLSKNGEVIANACLSSRKDFRNAVVAAREAFGKWSTATAFNRGQILYRAAEMLEGRRAQFIEELISLGQSAKEAEREVNISVDRLIYYSGWADKFQQVFSSVNPVSTSHFNFSLAEPMGVVAIVAPDEHPLLGAISMIAPVIAGGNSCVILASTPKPLCAVTLSEVLHSSDLPGGVVNLLCGNRKELLSHFASHTDVNALLLAVANDCDLKEIEGLAAGNLKRCHFYKHKDWSSSELENPYLILDTQEIKTTWHPIGS